MQRIEHLIAPGVLAVLLLPAWALADTHGFRVDPEGGGRVEFVSDATLETIHGVSEKLQGELRFDPNDLSTASGKLRVPVAAMRTGIALRDEHLRGDDWLDAKKHPHVTFVLTKVSGAKRLEPGKTRRLRLHGKLSLHGVTRKVVAQARARYEPRARGDRQGGGVIRGKARFSLELDDYDIDIPLPVRLKVANEIVLNVVLRAAAVGAS